MDADAVRSSRITARALLVEAARLYDATDAPFARAARTAWRTGFTSAAAWMDLALDVIAEDQKTKRARPRRDAKRPSRFNLHGLAKNGGAALVALAIASAVGAATATSLASCALGALIGLVTFVLAFYAVEGQMVFLFPILLDGLHDGRDLVSLFVECRAWTVRAGGTVAVMRVVMPIASRMMFGGLFGHGVVRSWCLGCLAVVLWYDALRARQDQGATEDRRSTREQPASEVVEPAA
jgi:hypothetical protein